MFFRGPCLTKDLRAIVYATNMLELNISLCSEVQNCAAEGLKCYTFRATGSVNKWL
jgi:hypothetical protein